MLSKDLYDNEVLCLSNKQSEDFLDRTLAVRAHKLGISQFHDDRSSFNSTTSDGNDLSAGFSAMTVSTDPSIILSSKSASSPSRSSTFQRSIDSTDGETESDNRLSSDKGKKETASKLRKRSIAKHRFFTREIRCDGKRSKWKTS